MPVKATSRVYIRTSEPQKRLLSQAAEARHMNTSQFMLQVSLDAAQSIVADQTIFTMTPEQWDAFQRRLDEPVRVIPALQELHAEMTNG